MNPGMDVIDLSGQRLNNLIYLKPDEDPNDIIERNKELTKKYTDVCFWPKDPSKVNLVVNNQEESLDCRDDEEKQAALDLIAKQKAQEIEREKELAWLKKNRTAVKIQNRLSNPREKADSLLHTEEMVNRTV